MRPLTEEEKSLVADNIGIAYEAYARLRHRFIDHLESDDIRSLCFLGLIDAVRYYDASRGTTLSTLVNTCIYRKILDARDKAMSSRREHGFDERAMWHESHEDGPVKSAMRRETVEIVQRAISRLTPREAESVRSLLLDDDTLMECGRRMGVSFQAAHQARNRGMKKLRDRLIGVA